MLESGARISGDPHADNLAAMQQARQQAQALFDDHDLLLAPSAGWAAPLATQGTGDPLFCRAWTLLGLPCLHLPLGTGEQGLPIGLQLIGHAGDDARVLQAGALLHGMLQE